jgi:hypothetical protein
MVILKRGVVVATLEDWRVRGGPKSCDQWVDGRSAKEAARAWIAGESNQIPDEVHSVLIGHPAFGPLDSWEGEPEVRLRFDDFAGETRNTDLLVVPMHGKFVIGVEAKADEPFGELVSETLTAAIERKLINENSNGMRRIERLAGALFGPRQDETPSVGELRYQLLTACAGILCEADRRGCRCALMLVQEFFTDRTKDELHGRNARDFDRFIKRLSRGHDSSIRHGEILGPYLVPGKPLPISSGVRLYVGKVFRNLRQGCALDEPP